MGIRFEAFRYLVAVDHYHRFDYIQLQSFWTLSLNFPSVRYM